MNKPLRIDMLGELRVRVGERTITRFSTRHAASLLAFLAFYRHQSHPREVLYEMLWPGCAPKDGRSRLSTTLSSLRRQLEPPGTPTGALFQTTYFGIGLNPAAVTTDVADFLATLKGAERAKDRDERAGHLRRAVELYQGELLPGFYEDWVLTEQRRLADLFERAREELDEWDESGSVGAPEASTDPVADRAGTADRSFAPSPAPDTPTTPPSLPLVFTRFFGRQEEIARLSEMLLLPDVRLVTLSGPGGTGKTRLAREVAARLDRAFPGGVWFIALADLRYARLIGSALADAMRLPRESKQEPLEQAIDALSRQASLLVLDNFEHLVEEGSGVVQTLLEQVPTLTCLVTSRRLLDLTAEREFALRPLPTPRGQEPIEQLSEIDSVRLFVERAQAARPDFQVTERNAAAMAALVEHLEGIPLAIELAAARALVLSPGQMLALLSGRRFEFLVGKKRDAAGRHRSLLATLDWSYDLLAPDLQRFFRCLSVFRGGWAVEAAEAVCEQPRALEYLEHLRENSLVLTEETETGIRFRILETLREYSAGHLSADETAAIRNCHRSYFVAFAEEVRTRLFGPEMATLLDRLETEHDNLRAVFDGCLLDGDAESAAASERLLRCITGFWRMRGHTREMRERCVALLTHPVALGRTSLRAWALSEAANAGGERNWHEEALAIRRELGDSGWIGRSLNDLGACLWAEGYPDRAAALLEEALSIWRQMGSRPATCTTLINLGGMARSRADYALARERLAEAREICRETGDRKCLSMILGNLALIAVKEGDERSARALFSESLAISRDLEDLPTLAGTLLNLAGVEWSAGRAERAARLLGAAEAIRRDIGEVADADEHERIGTIEAAATADEALGAALEAGRAMDWQEAATFALADS